MNTLMLLGCILSSASTIRIMPEGPVAEGFFGMPEPSSAEELAPFTLHAWGSPEELESLLAGGYPTPEIRATLEDASIPEEDRYWLDCRMRSLIAQMLHRFYDREGNVIEVEAEWITPGEKYWQEVMVVPLPVVREDSPSSDDESGGVLFAQHLGDTRYRAEGPTVAVHIPTGHLINLYGEQVGQLAIASQRPSCSRDASITVQRTGTGRNFSITSTGSSLFFCFLYPDGSYREVDVPAMYPWAFNNGHSVVSQDGSISAWHIFSPREPRQSYILVYDMWGNPLESYELPQSFRPTLDGITISGDNNFIACSASGPHGAGIIDRRTGDIWWFDRGADWPPVFSENSRFCMMLGPSRSYRIRVVDFQSGLFFSIPDDRVTRASAAISNDGAILATGRDIYLNGVNVISLQLYRHTSLSPNGYFYLGSSHPTPRGIGALHILLNLRSLREGVE